MKNLSSKEIQKLWKLRFNVSRKKIGDKSFDEDIVNDNKKID